MKVLFIGDIIGGPGRKITARLLPVLKKEYGPFDFIIANCENAAGGKGLTEKVMRELFSYGIDLMTSGNHIWDKKDFIYLLDEEPDLLRPANYPPSCPGSGTRIIKKNGKTLGVVNVQGRVFMPPLDCPFRRSDEVLEEMQGIPVLVDFHAEATSEKRVLGYYLDGRVSAFIGTHTHVQTADEEILPKGTAYITDAGMTGPHQSAIGMSLDSVLPRFLTGMPTRFEVATEGLRLCGVLVDIDEKSLCATNITRINLAEHE